MSRLLNISPGFGYIRVLNILQSSPISPTLLPLGHQPPYPRWHATNDLSPITANEVFNFQENESYNLRSGIHLTSRNMHIAHFGVNTISSLGSKLWKLVPDKIKHASKLSAFKANNKSWTINNCHANYANICWGYLFC